MNCDSLGRCSFRQKRITSKACLILLNLKDNFIPRKEFKANIPDQEEVQRLEKLKRFIHIVDVAVKLVGVQSSMSGDPAPQHHWTTSQRCSSGLTHRAAHNINNSYSSEPLVKEWQVRQNLGGKRVFSEQIQERLEEATGLSVEQAV